MKDTAVYQGMIYQGAEQKECGCEERLKVHECGRRRRRRHGRPVNLSVAEVGAGRMLSEGAGKPR